MAKRLDWEKAAKMQKVKREGSDFGYDELPSAGSHPDERRFLENKGHRQAEIWTKGFRKKKKASNCKENTGAMREALETIHRELVAVYDRENSRLMANEVWQKLSLKERQYLRHRFDLQKPLPLKIATEEEINSTLRESSLAKRQNFVALMPQRFQAALAEATRLLAPEDHRIPSGRKSPRRL